MTRAFACIVDIAMLRVFGIRPVFFYGIVVVCILVAASLAHLGITVLEAMLMAYFGLFIAGMIARTIELQRNPGILPTPVESIEETLDEARIRPIGDPESELLPRLPEVVLTFAPSRDDGR